MASSDVPHVTITYNQFSPDFQEIHLSKPRALAGFGGKGKMMLVKITDANGNRIRVQCSAIDGTKSADFKNGVIGYVGDSLFRTPFGLSKPFKWTPGQELPSKLGLDLSIESSSFEEFMYRLERHLRQLALDSCEDLFGCQVTVDTVEKGFTSSVVPSDDYQPRLKTRAYIRPEESATEVRPRLDVFVRKVVKQDDGSWKWKNFPGTLRHITKKVKLIPTIELSHLLFQSDEFSLKILTTQILIVRSPPSEYLDLLRSRDRQFDFNFGGQDNDSSIMPLESEPLREELVKEIEPIEFETDFQPNSRQRQSMEFEKQFETYANGTGSSMKKRRVTHDVELEY